MFPRPRTTALLFFVSLMAGCAGVPMPVALPDPPVPDTTMTDVPHRSTSPIDVAELASLQASEPAIAEVSPRASRQAMAWANARAMVRPSKKDFRGAEVRYPYVPGKIWFIETVPFAPTHLQFELNTGGLEWSGLDVGDHGWWEVKAFQTGVAPHAQGHLLVLAKAAGKAGKMTVLTDLGRFYLAFRSTESAGVTAVSWTHPTPVKPVQRQDSGVYGVGYTITVESGAPLWRPVTAWDRDGQTFIQAAEAMRTGESPVVYVRQNNEPHIVNYRLQNNVFVIDHVGEPFELRRGSDDQAEVVLIDRAASYRYVRCPGESCPARPGDRADVR